MKTQCMICEHIDDIEDSSLLAKKLKYNRIKSYLCEPCYTRITQKTLQKHDSGHFHLYQYPDHSKKRTIRSKKRSSHSKKHPSN